MVSLVVDQNNLLMEMGEMVVFVPSAQIAAHKILSYEDISNWLYVAEL